MRLKRVISILVSLSLLIGAFQSNALYAQAATNGYYTYTVADNGTVTITDCDTSISGSVTIPSTLEGYPVTCIGEAAFKKCKNLTSVVIPNTVETILNNAFAGCSNMKQVTIPNSVTYIDDYAFLNCDALTSVKLPDNLTYMGKYIFWTCEKLASIEFGKNMTSIGFGMFTQCPGLTTIEIPDNIEHIENCAFEGCDGLKSIKIGKGVTTIDGEAFQGCSGLEHILLPDKAVNFEKWSLSGLDSIKTIWIPEGVKTIPSNCFYGCENLLTIRIPDSVTSIGSDAFSFCDKLKSVFIPNSVTSIEPSAFLYYGSEYVVIYCEKGSYAESFAIENNIPYVAENVLSNDYNEKVVNDLYSENMIFQELGIYAPEYLHNNMINTYTSNYVTACSNVLNDYSDVEIVQLAFLEGFIKGSDYISNKLLSFLGAQTSGEKLIEETTLSLLQEIEKQETVIYDSWNVVNKAYNDLSFAYKSTEILSKAELVRVLSEKSEHLTSETITEIVDSAYKNINELGINEAFDATGKAFDIVDLTIYCCQLYDVQMETIERLISCTPENSTLYEGLVIIKNQREKNASSYVIDNFLQKEIASELEGLIGKAGKYATTKLASMDVSVLMAVVTLTSNVLYNYVYQGAKVSDINKAIILSEFYNTISIALSDKHIELLNKKIINESPSQQLLDDYKWLWNTRLSCLKTYSEMCVDIAKNDQDKNLLNNYIENHDEIIGFENYILNCYNEYRHAVNENKIHCSHYRAYKLKTVQATCTTSSYSIYRCITCNNEYASDEGAIEGHIYLQQIIAPTCSNEGYTIYTCQNCRHSYKADYVNCIEHSFTITNVAATCITNGYTEQSCTLCGLVYTYDFTEAYGHSYDEWIILSQPTPARVGRQYKRCTSCSKNVVVQIPKIELPSFSSASITLQDNLIVNYKVSRDYFEEIGYEKPYVKFVINDKETIVSDYTILDDCYVFCFSGIAPNQINDTIYATLCSEYSGIVYESDTKEYSVAMYCYNMLNKYTTDEYDELKTLLVDLLNYGAASQIYTNNNTDNLANTLLTAEEASWGTQDSIPLKTVLNKEYETIDNATVAWRGAGLNLKDSVSMRFKIATDSIENLTVKVVSEHGKQWTINSSSFEKTTDGYYILFNGFHVGQMSEIVYVTVYQDEMIVSNTLRYSIESYAYSKQNDNNKNLVNLLQAMMKYGNSAYLYTN